LKEPNPTKLYLVNGILVEATKTEGGLFYDVKILKTGAVARILTKIFEDKAKEVKDGIKS